MIDIPPQSQFEGRSQATECVVLLSGGLDSAARVHFYLQNFAVRGLHLSYGQPSERQEHEAAVSIANHYQIPLSIIQLNGARPKECGEILGRNSFLLFAALTAI